METDTNSFVSGDLVKLREFSFNGFYFAHKVKKKKKKLTGGRLWVKVFQEHREDLSNYYGCQRAVYNVDGLEEIVGVHSS